MAILESDGWKYYAEFVKAYAPNAAGQTLNEDPNLTVFQLDNAPLINNIPGLGNASSNQILLPQDLEYEIEAETILTSASSYSFNIYGLIWDATLSDRIGYGKIKNAASGAVGASLHAYARTLKLSANKLIEFKALKIGHGPAASDVSVTNNFSGGAALTFTNSTAGLEIRTSIKIKAK